MDSNDLPTKHQIDNLIWAIILLTLVMLTFMTIFAEKIIESLHEHCPTDTCSVAADES